MLRKSAFHKGCGLMFDSWVQSALAALVEFKVPEALVEISREKNIEAVPAEEIAKRCGTHPESTYRFLRVATVPGHFFEHENRSFSLTETGKILLEDHPQSLKNFFILSSAIAKMMAHSDESLVTGGSSVSKALNVSTLWELFQKEPQFVTTFENAMREMTIIELPGILELFDPKGIKKFVDLSAGPGALSFGILQKFPDLKATLCDLPIVCSKMKIPEALKERVTLHPYNLLDSTTFPKKLDAYIIKYAIHNWTDDKCVEILSNIRKAARSDSRIIVIEMIIEGRNKPDAPRVFDLCMNVLLGSKERTKDEFEELAAKAGLKIVSVRQGETGGPALIEMKAI